MAPAPALPDARSVAAQLASAPLAAQIAPGRDGTVELHLSPEELGRVRMTIHHDAQVISVIIHADRPETLDLMRRHGDILAQEFRAQGYSSTAFSFTGGTSDDPRHGPGRQADPRPANDGTAHTAEAARPAPQSPTRPTADGLDLRL